MKRFAFLLSIPLLLSGCAQVFDGNMFQAIDAPPPLSTSTLSNASVADIQSQMADDAFYEQLKDDPKALEAVQSALEGEFDATALTAADTAEEKASVVEAAQAYVLVTAFGSDAGEVANDAIKEASNLVSGGSPDEAVTNLLAGKSEAEITVLLDQFQQMNNALLAMQTMATVDGEVDSDLFFADSEQSGDLAQIALVAAAVSAMVADNGGDSATLAALLASGGSPATGSNMTQMTDALGGDNDPANNDYAYLSAVTGILPF